MSEVRVVDLKELGVNKEVFDKIYSMGEQDGRADAIDEVTSLFADWYGYGYEKQPIYHLMKQLKD